MHTGRFGGAREVMAIVTLDKLTSTSLGTGTTKTQINGAADYFIPGTMNAIHYLIGYHASTGATTAAQTYKPVLFLESTDITPNISPVHYPMPGECGGLGTTTAGSIPALDKIPVNVTCRPGNRIQGYGQYLTANTVAGRLGIGMGMSNAGTGGKRRAFYEVGGSPTGTAAGTAAATVSGSDITITGAEKAWSAFTRFYPTTITASEDYIGVCNFSSGNWESEPLSFPYQPIGSALGALIAVGDFSSDGMRTLAIERTFKGSGQYVVNNSVTIDESLTGNGTFINGIAFTKQGV